MGQWLDQIPKAEIEASPQLYIATIWRQVVGKLRPARSARLALACGQLETASRWAETYRLRFDDPLQLISGYFESMTLACVLLARGRSQRITALAGAHPPGTLARHRCR